VVSDSSIPLLSATADNSGLNTRHRTFRRDSLGQAPASTPARRFQLVPAVREQSLGNVLALDLIIFFFYRSLTISYSLLKRLVGV